MRLTRTDYTSRRAFSLIEVLISIVVLALGLLGIAAVFPLFALMLLGGREQREPGHEQ